jgi:hypothetical protein
MEDLFQIIFILIFIISSIVSSINKKKKKQQKAAKPKPVVVKKPQTATTKKAEQKTTSQILEEMLGLKIELPEPQKSEAPPDYSEKSLKADTWDPSKEFDDRTDDGESNYQEKISAKKSQFLEDRKKHLAFKKEEKTDVREVVRSSTRNKLFAKDANLKDYIIVQEILNKPKALRR